MGENLRRNPGGRFRRLALGLVQAPGRRVGVPAFFGLLLSDQEIKPHRHQHRQEVCQVISVVEGADDAAEAGLKIERAFWPLGKLQ